MPYEDNFDDDSVTGDPFGARPLARIDPANEAAHLLIENALQDGGADLAPAGADGAVVLIHVPTPEWVDPVCRAWLKNVQNGEVSGNGYQRSYGCYSARAAWVAREADTRSSIDVASEISVKAVAAGHHSVTFTSNLQWAPSDVRICAHHVLRLAALNGAAIVKFTERRCGDAPTTIPSDWTHVRNRTGGCRSLVLLHFARENSRAIH
jgi:hypothetical protein